MSDVFDLEIPKTTGIDGKSSLMVDIRTDVESLGPGLFVCGFLPGSQAEAQGLLEIGDELLVVNDVDVEGGTIDDLVYAMQSEEYANSNYVPVMIRRQSDASRHVSTVTTPFVAHQAIAMKNEILAVDLKPNRSDHDVLDHGTEENGLLNDNVVFEVNVPKTNNSLQLDIQSKVQDAGKGLFICGFTVADSMAEEQGILQVDDEVLEINGIDVSGGTIEDVDNLLSGDVFPDVLLKIRRASRPNGDSHSAGTFRVQVIFKYHYSHVHTN